MRNQKFDSYIKDDFPKRSDEYQQNNRMNIQNNKTIIQNNNSLTQNNKFYIQNNNIQTQYNNMITQDNKLQISNINQNKTRRCSSINENQKIRELYALSEIQNKDHYIFSKVSTTMPSMRKRSSQIRQEIVCDQNDDIKNERQDQFTNVQSLIQQTNKINETQQYTLKVNGNYICDLSSKRRSKSQFTESEFKDTKRNSYQSNEITLFQPEFKYKNKESILNKSFVKMDAQTEYLFMRKTKTPEKNQIAKLQNYADKSYGYNGINYTIQNGKNKPQNYECTIQNQKQNGESIIQLYPNKLLNSNINKFYNVNTSQNNRDQIQNNSFIISDNNNISQNHINIVQVNENTMKNNVNKKRSYSSNQKSNTTQTCASPVIMDSNQQFKVTLGQFNDYLQNDGNIQYNKFSSRRNTQGQYLYNQNPTQKRVCNLISRNSRISNISSTTCSINQNFKLKKRINTLRSDEQLQIEVNGEENSEKDDGSNKCRDEQSVLAKCEKKINSSIKMLERCLSQAQNVNEIILNNKEKYEKEGNKEMLELLKNYYKQPNLDDEKSKAQDFSVNKNKQISNINESQKLNKKQIVLSITNPEDENNQEINKNSEVVYSSPKRNEEVNTQSILKKQINESIKRIEKYLDYSIQVSKQSTIQMEQTSLINPINIKQNEIYLKEESFIHRTINYLQYNHKVLSVDIFYSNYQTLPFDLKELEKDNTFLLGEGAFGKVYRVKLYPKNKRYQYLTITSHHKQKNKNNSHAVSQSEGEDEEYALKVIKLKDMIELERKSTEIIIEYYLQSKQFKHSCQLLLPAYFIQKNEQMELLFLKKLADFNFTKLLNKRREKYLAYTEFELLYIFKELMIIIKDLHERNVAHRDIKPSNFVFLQKDKSWKLIDFGTAKIEQDLQSVKEYNVCGTRLYAIPKISEMKNFGELQSKIKMSLKAYDLYSLGITFIKIKKLLINPFDQKALKKILSSGELLDDTELSNVIINSLINPIEEERINLDLNYYIEKADEYLKRQNNPKPNDFGVMYDLHSDFNYTKQSCEDQDQFDRALTFKKINKLDDALHILFPLYEKDTQNKLKANITLQIGQIYMIKGNYLNSLKYLEQAKYLIMQAFPKESIKCTSQFNFNLITNNIFISTDGEIYEELGQIHFLLNKRDEGLQYFKQAFKIYQKNPLDCQYRINKLKSRLTNHGLHINVLNEQLSYLRQKKKQFTVQYSQNQTYDKINLMRQRSIQQEY